jgi:excisionase family DNA binding protein
VCGEALEQHTEATCDNCGQLYHLNQRTDLPGKDCGQVWINDEHLALEFACNTCLHPAPAPAILDEVLDVSEAAELTGLSEDALRRAADRGELRHRRTGSGVYLFVRGDVEPLIQGRR